MKLLILSADDFGTSQTANATIERLFNEKAITAAGIVVNAPAAADAVFRAIENHMDIGIQWRLPQSMDDPDGMSIMFELESQYSFLAEHGLIPDHASNPSWSLSNYCGNNFMSEALMVCRGHNIPFRMPQTYDELLPIVSPEIAEYMEGLSMLNRPTVESAWLFNIMLPNIVTSSHIEIAPPSYEALKAGSIKKLNIMPNGVSVMYLNPCDESDESKELYKDWQKRAWEAQLLTDPEFVAALDGFVLADYAKAFAADTYTDSPM